MAVASVARTGANRAQQRKRASRARKGFVFTSAAIVIVAVFIILTSSAYHIYPRTAAQTARVHTMDGYLQSLAADLPRAAYIAGFRCFIAMEERISTTNKYITSANSAFTECFMNGTINGTSYAILDDSTFGDFAQKFSLLAADQGMISNISIRDVSVRHTAPFTIEVVVALDVQLADSARTASFNRSMNVTAQVPITDIKDPLYTIGTQGKIPHPVVLANISQPYITVTNDTTNLRALFNASTYIANTNAPSFLQRFEGNFSPSPYGIQSLVNVHALTLQDIPVDQCRSLVDWRYFGLATSTTYAIVNTDPSIIWLGAADLSTYDATGKTVGTVCT